MNHITLPSLNENLVGLNHRLITQRSLPGQQTTRAFPQAGADFSASHRSARLTNPSSGRHLNSSTHSDSVLDSGQHIKTGEGQNPITKQTEQEGWKQWERVRAANFSTFPPLWLKQWQIIYHTFWVHASWPLKKKGGERERELFINSISWLIYQDWVSRGGEKAKGHPCQAVAGGPRRQVETRILNPQDLEHR